MNKKWVSIFLVIFFTSGFSTQKPSEESTKKAGPSWVPAPALQWKSFEVKPKKHPFTLSQFPTIPVKNNQFVPYINPPTQKSITLTKADTHHFTWSELPSRSIQLRTYLLGSPPKVKTELPQMKLQASEPVMIFNKSHGVVNGSNINCFMQDELGRIWIGTNEGLSVYDGEHSYTYKKRHGLSDKRVWSIAQDSNGLIWVGTFSGLDIINTETNTISHVNSKGWLHENFGFKIHIDSKNKVWFGTGTGLFLIDLHENEIKKFSTQLGIPSQYVRSVFEDSQERIWMGGPNGTSILDQKKQTITYLSKTAGFSDSMVEDIIQDSNNVYLIGYQQGLYRYFEKDQRVEIYDPSMGFPDFCIQSLIKDKNNLLHVGTRHHGIVLIDFKKQKLKEISVKEGLSSEYVPTQFFDSKNQHWLGGFNGINIINTQLGRLERLGPENGFTGRNFASLFESTQGDIWIGGKIGIDIYHPYSKTITKLKPSDYFGHKGVLSFFESSTGKIYIGTIADGLLIYDPQMATLNQITQSQGLGHNQVCQIKEDRKGIIWISTLSGLNTFNPNTNELKLAKTVNGSKDQTYLNIEFVSKDEIWFATRTGLFRYFPQVNLVENLPLTGFSYGERINSLLSDSLGTVWIGTDEHGLFQYDRATEMVIQVPINRVSNDNSINNILIQNQTVFLTTHKSLTTIDQITGVIRTFNKTQGLPSINFNQNSNLILRNGEIWWGNNDGITVLEPKTIESSINSTQITSIDIMSQPQVFTSINWTLNKLNKGDTLWIPNTDSFYVAGLHKGPDSDCSFSFYSLTAPFYIPTNLELPYDQNNITFHFSGMYVNEQNQAKYKYILEGLEDEWSLLTASSEIEYRNLHPGQYTFLVTSCGISEMCGLPTQFSFIVHPPFWQTTWFYIVCGFFVAVLIYLYNRYRENLFKQQTDLLELEVTQRTQEFKQEKERAELSEQFKQQFLANMSHEIRTPMNAVLGMTNLTLDTELNEKQRKYLNAVQKSSENLLVIINDILDLSKLEAGKMELEHIPFKVDEIIQQVQTTLRFKAEEKGLQFTTHISELVPSFVVGDPSRLVQVLINLCGNAIKFTHQGSVTLNTNLMRRTEATLVFEVLDTGIGIPKEKINELFQSFHQVDTSTYRKYGGTGLGLSISQTLVELQDGKIQVFSKENEGSKFTVTIPYQIASEKDLASIVTISEKETTSLTGIKILLAEDNEYNQIVAIDTLKQLVNDVQIDTAENGLIALDLLQKNQYDLVLMDVNMPKCNGLQATQRIRKELPSPIHKIPVIALTASVLSSDIQKCMDAGMDGYIPKPFTRTELLTELSRVYHSNEELMHPKIKVVQKRKSRKGNKNDKVTNLTYLKEFCNQDKIREKKYVNLYLKSIRTSIKQLRKALYTDDLRKVKSIIHTCKPHFVFMGMQSNTFLVQEIEGFQIEKNITNEQKNKVNELITNCIKSVKELS